VQKRGTTFSVKNGIKWGSQKQDTWFYFGARTNWMLFFVRLGYSNADVIDDFNEVIDLTEHFCAQFFGRFCVQEGTVISKA
jgi:hypothetical protein